MPLRDAIQHHRAGRLVEAERLYRSVLEQTPRNSDALHLLGMVCFANGKAEQGIAYVRRAINEDPTVAQYSSNLGIILRTVGRINEAIDAYQVATRINPGYGEAFTNMGFAYAVQGRLDEAIACYRQAIKLDPSDSRLHSNLLQTLHYHPDFSPARLLEEHQAWNLKHAEQLRSLVRPYRNDQDPERRLRIGYVSSDFRNHACAFFSEPLFKNHDRRWYELVCYSGVTCPDEVTKRFRNSANLWRDCARLSDDDMTEVIRVDLIDILIDMSLHTTGNRLLVFARKPAPVQVTWLGYASTSGLNTIDYRISDPMLDPSGLDSTFATEESVRLDTYWCFDPGTDEPPVGRLPALERGYVTFGCMNNFCKVNDIMLELWAKVLNQVPRSRLCILSDPDSHQQRTLEFFWLRGIGQNRLEFPHRRPRPEYLELYHQLDIVLDTFPYSGVTTTFDAIWMGVPVISLAGQTGVSRAGLSILSNIGLADLVAETAETYVAKAVALATDMVKLAGMRSCLRQMIIRSNVMDAVIFTRQMEAAYREIWRRWCSAEPHVSNRIGSDLSL